MQPVRVFGANAVRVLGELVCYCFCGPALAGEMPHHGLEGLAALTFWRAVADQVVIVRRGLWTGVVEIEAIGLLSCFPGVAREERVDKPVERRQLSTRPALERAHRDVTLGVTVDFKTGAGIAVERKSTLLVL